MRVVCGGQQLVPPHANACDRDGERDAASRVAHLQLTPEPFEQTDGHLMAGKAHHDSLCRFADAQQVEHLGAGRAVRHAHEIHRRAFLSIDTQHFFALFYINDCRYDLYRALHRHLRSVFTHALPPPPKR